MRVQRANGPRLDTSTREGSPGTRGGRAAPYGPVRNEPRRRVDPRASKETLKSPGSRAAEVGRRVEANESPRGTDGPDPPGLPAVVLRGSESEGRSATAPPVRGVPIAALLREDPVLRAGLSVAIQGALLLGRRAHVRDPSRSLHLSVLREAPAGRGARCRSHRRARAGRSLALLRQPPDPLSELPSGEDFEIPSGAREEPAASSLFARHLRGDVRPRRGLVPGLS